jgi:glycosyltransferase involved in cell wall biosynthesis
VRTVLFYRHFVRFAGHHLKVWDYFNHVLASPRHTAFVRFTRQSLLDETNPWTAVPDRILDQTAEIDPDILLLSGMDWLQIDPALREDSPVPVLNLVIHPTHFLPENPRYQFLSNRAIRICMSADVAEALQHTGRLRGPLFTIPAAIDVGSVRSIAGSPERDIDLLVVALKNPEMGRSLAARLSRPRRNVHVLDERLSRRTELLELLARAKVTVFLPQPREGFYMPALEGMAVGTVVVCPDVLGNRSFCLEGVNCFRPPYDEDALFESAEAAFADLPNLGEMIERARRTADEHDLAGERESFLQILERVDELW